MREPLLNINNDIYSYDYNRSKIVLHKKGKSRANIALGIIIDTDLSIPPKHGVGYRLYYLSKALVKVGIKVKVFICNRNINKEEDLKKLSDKSGIEFHIIPENIFYNIPLMKKLVRDADVDILQMEDPASMLRYYPIATALNIPVCLEIHDVEATLMSGLGFKHDNINLSRITTYFASHFSDKIVCMTPTDKFELINDIGIDKNKLELIPNSINSDEFEYFGPCVNRPNILFVGNMFYWPNQNAARFIIEKLQPNLSKNIQFTLVGMAPESIRKLAFDLDNVTITGPVDNLNEYLKQASIALCPVTSGSGMKVKILNYCAAGLPVICTKIGASGYENIPSIIIEDSLDKYVKLITRLLKDKDNLKMIAKVNRQFVEKHYDMSIAAKNMTMVYQDILHQNMISSDKSALTSKEIELPGYLWLKEKRTGKPKNKNIYKIKNGKLI